MIKYYLSVLNFNEKCICKSCLVKSVCEDECEDHSNMITEVKQAWIKEGIIK